MGKGTVAIFSLIFFLLSSAASFSAEKEGFFYRSLGGLKYDKYGQIDPSPDAAPLGYMPKDGFGFVDWSAAVREGLIKPRDSIAGNAEEYTVLYSEDVLLKPRLDFMPDVIFPHSSHNKWLNCGNCHPKIFEMKAKASGISMVRIWKGEFCGRCHDKVAFPIRNCYRCHSGQKRW